jgi:hypothetical protein
VGIGWLFNVVQSDKMALREIEGERLPPVADVNTNTTSAVWLYMHA